MLGSQAQAEAVRQFADVLAGAGLLLKGLPVMDGQLHHVPTLGAKTKSDNAGVYVGHLDGGVPAGWFNNYRTDPLGEGQKWKATGVQETRSWAEIQKAWEETERLRAQEEQKRREQEERIARWAERKWNRSEPATAHPYLERKRVEAHDLRIDEKQHLVVPMRDGDGRIWSLQTIAEDGEKHFTKGGRRQGTFAQIGPLRNGEPLAIAEGYATGASVHRATGFSTVIAFTSGNLLPVAVALQARYPESRIIFAADNDHHLPKKQTGTGRFLPNDGLEKATQAAEAVQGVVVPPPAVPAAPKGTDWNDYEAQYGVAAVRRIFIESLQERGIHLPFAAVTRTPSRQKEVQFMATPTGTSIEEQISTPPSSMDLEKEVLEAYQQGTFLDWRRLHPVSFGAANVDEIWKTGGTPEFQIKEGGIYQLVLDSTGSKGYVVPDPHLQMTPHYVRAEGFSSVFTGYQPTGHDPMRLDLLQPAAVEKQGDRWVVTQKGEVQPVTLDRPLGRDTTSPAPVSWRQEQIAKEKAIAVANALPGGPERNQELLSHHYDELRARDRTLDGTTAWQLAAERLKQPMPTGEVAREQPSAMSRSTVESEHSREQGVITAPSQDVRPAPTLNSSPRKEAAQLIEQGAAPYQFDKNNGPSYFVKLREQDGMESFRWDKELPAALEKAGAQIGDFVSVERTGQVPVVVPVPIKDAEGKVVRTESLETHRNEWQIDVVARPEDGAAQRVTTPPRTDTTSRAGDALTPQDRSKEDRLSTPTPREQEYWNRRAELPEERQTRYDHESRRFQERLHATEKADAERPRTTALERWTREDVEKALQTGTSLAGKDLSGLDLSGLKFERVDLSGSNLSNTRNVHTTYESSRLDGANFSDALFQNSTLERVHAPHSRWDRAQFDQTNIVFSNFGHASFQDATFRDRVRTAEREEPSRLQAQSRAGAQEQAPVPETGRPPATAGWGERAARTGNFLKDVGKALKEASVQVYQQVRDWWSQPIRLAPEIERNPAALWNTPFPSAASPDPQPPAWSVPSAERAPTQSPTETIRPSRGDRENRRPDEQEEGKRAVRGPSVDTRSSEPALAHPLSTAAPVEPERLPPALIARNNFQFADLTGARFETIRVQDNDFRHAVLTNAQFPAELPETNKIERPAAAARPAVGPEISPKQPGSSPQQAPAEIEQRPDREKLAETLRREIESRSQKLREGDSGFSREADALHLAKEMLRQVEAGAARIDLTTTYRAADQDAAEERHVRAYNSVNPLIAEAYAKGITVDRGSVQVERAQAITEEAARLQEDLNATQKGQDRNELVAETKNLAAESVSLRTTGEAQEQELRSDLDREGMIPFLTMGQERFDALLSVGVFDAGKTLEWRKEMDGKISERFRVLSEDAASHGKDPRALWQEAAKQVQQSSVLTQPGREGASLDRGREREDLGQALTQKQELRRTVALAR